MPDISTFDLIVRMLAATLFGGLIGLDREFRNHPAGLRTHMLISLAAAAFTLLAFQIYQDVKGDKSSDPIRAIEAVTAGVAFLAAGGIFRSAGDIKGLTTGAAMWLAGAVGVAAGGGYFEIAAIATTFAMLILVVLRLLEPADLLPVNANGDDDKSKSAKSKAVKKS